MKKKKTLNKNSVQFNHNFYRHQITRKNVLQNYRRTRVAVVKT